MLSIDFARRERWKYDLKSDLNVVPAAQREIYCVVRIGNLGNLAPPWVHYCMTRALIVLVVGASSDSHTAIQAAAEA